MKPTDAACELLAELDVLLSRAATATPPHERASLLAHVEICAGELERLLDHLEGPIGADVADACAGVRTSTVTAPSPSRAVAQAA